MAATQIPVTVGPASAPQNPTGTTPATGGGTKIAGIPDWVAGLAAFGILFILAETEAAQLADVLAWGVALGYVFTQAQRGTLKFSSFNPNPKAGG